MSQHYLKTSLRNAEKIRVVIQAGWDRPLGGYFCMVYAIDKNIPEQGFQNQSGWELSYAADDILYSNLSEIESHPTDFSFFIRRLEALGLNLPDNFVEAIEEDGRNNEGNKVVEHGVC